MKFSKSGFSEEEILNTLKSAKANDVDWRNGKVWSYVYFAGEDVERVAKNAYMEFLSENGIDVTAFPSLQRLENDVIGMVREILRGDDNVCGSITTGGTESLLLAIKSARDYCKKENPEVILPATVHSSFFKACHYFNVKPVVVSVDQDFKADVNAIRNAITENTILIAASAPSYAYGVIDPIKEIGALALEKNLLFHVDGCIGGFIGSIMRLNGYNLPDFDFSIPGVTSISVDLHKYAYTPKGASVLLFKNEELRKNQYFVCNTWTGYTVVNPTILSSKTGGPIAAAWAVMNYLGLDGYAKIVNETMAATQKIKDGLKAIPDIYIIGQPQMSMMAFTCTEPSNVYELVDELKGKGWNVGIQFAHENAPVNIHLTVTYNQVHLVEEFLEDVAAGMKKIKKASIFKAMDMAKFSAAKSIGNNFGGDVMEKLAPMLGIKDGQLPEKMAVVNHLLNDLPKEISKELLLNFMSKMCIPR